MQVHKVDLTRRRSMQVGACDARTSCSSNSRTTEIARYATSTTGELSDDLRRIALPGEREIAKHIRWSNRFW